MGGTCPKYWPTNREMQQRHRAFNETKTLQLKKGVSIGLKTPTIFGKNSKIHHFFGTQDKAKKRILRANVEIRLRHSNDHPATHRPTHPPGL